MNAIHQLLSAVPTPLAGSADVVTSTNLPAANDFLSSLDQTSATELTDRANQQRIEKAGSEFEAVFLSLLLKEMRNTLDSENGGLFGGEGSDTFGGMFDLFMGQHLAEASPLGIGDAVKSYLGNLP